MSLGLVILGVLTERALQLPFPVDLAVVTAILVRRRLDTFCNCQ